MCFNFRKDPQACHLVDTSFYYTYDMYDIPTNVLNYYIYIINMLFWYVEVCLQNLENQIY